MEVARFPDDLFLEFVVVHVDCRLNKHDRRGTPASNHNALGDQGTAHRPRVIFYGFGVASQAGLRLYPVVISSSRDPPSWENLLE
jgi:hypothetical protein